LTKSPFFHKKYGWLSGAHNPEISPTILHKR
jgi:hypothetical protein